MNKNSLNKKIDAEMYPSTFVELRACAVLCFVSQHLRVLGHVVADEAGHVDGAQPSSMLYASLLTLLNLLYHVVSDRVEETHWPTDCEKAGIISRTS